MKPVYILALLLLFSINISFAQDTLMMRNNTIVLAKVLEINTDIIKYKKFEMPDGPNYTEDKANVKEIRFVNGLKEKFELDYVVAGNKSQTNNQIPGHNSFERHGPVLLYKGNIVGEKELQSILMATNDKEIMTLTLKMEKTNKLKHIGLITIPFAVIAAGSLLVASLGEPDALYLGAACVAITIPLGVIGIVNTQCHIHYREDATQLYNLKY